MKRTTTARKVVSKCINPKTRKIEKMSKLNIQIQESSESKESRINDKFKSGILSSLSFPIQDEQGYVKGTFIDFEPIEPTGEIKQGKNGSVWTDNRYQLKFVFQVPCEDGSTLDLKFWTGTCIDGVKNEKDEYSKLVTWLIAIGAIDEKELHPRWKADESSIMPVIQEVFEKQFKFKTVMDGRIHKPVLSTFELVDE